jgi:hypothetical protein
MPLQKHNQYRADCLLACLRRACVRFAGLSLLPAHAATGPRRGRDAACRLRLLAPPHRVAEPLANVVWGGLENRNGNGNAAGRSGGNEGFRAPGWPGFYGRWDLRGFVCL